MPSATLSWETVDSDAGNAATFPELVRRAKVPGGWLVYVETRFQDDEEEGVNSIALTFLPDIKHEWGTVY
jgi:hypothetical protein